MSLKNTGPLFRTSYSNGVSVGELVVCSSYKVIDNKPAKQSTQSEIPRCCMHGQEIEADGARSV